MKQSIISKRFKATFFHLIYFTSLDNRINIKIYIRFYVIEKLVFNHMIYY